MPRVLSPVGRVIAAIPGTSTLPSEEWERRHQWIAGLLAAHAPGIALFALFRGFGIHGLLEALIVPMFALAAYRQSLSPRTRSIVTGMGLMISSALLTHLSGGRTEMHFHFFVMIAVISLYQDWRPFLASIAFVASHHAIFGVIRPEDVFDTPEAWRNPIKWALIHAVFVLAMSAVCVVSWGIIEEGHKRSRRQLEDNERRFRSLIENSTDVVTVMDPDGVITYDSPAAERVLGYLPGERVGTKGLDYVHADDLDQAYAALARAADTRTTVHNLVVRGRHKNGTYRWIECSIANLADEVGVDGTVANFRDITDRRNLEIQLAHQAFHDPLTGLANRALLSDRLEHSLAASGRLGGRRVALLYLDLDDFKTVNDGLGHDAGDDILRETARRLSSAIRPGDTASRLGGDEFAVLLEEIDDPETAYEVGARVLEALAAPFDLEGAQVPISASLGIAVSTVSDDAAALLRNADLAMYRAKGDGKGRFEVYERGMHAAVVERMAMKADLRRGVQAGEFEAYYQPIVELASGRVTGVEALVRWNHPEKGVVPPLTFIPLAEETGLIVSIGRDVLRQSCHDLAQWQRELGALAPATVSVNLSARQLADPTLLDDVTSALEDACLPPSALTLEVTESVLLSDTDAAASTLQILKRMGVSLALDDFGTGYSSLSHLERFPVDIVKIDKSFVDGLGGADSPLVAAIVHLGDMFHLAVTAEGIEDERQLACLQQLGCQRGQGYYFARPLPADQLRAQLAAGFALSAH
jgi:diguanylate cyclase (GGDEF)-like protein/PAS domain S-box-containing protein